MNKIKSKGWIQEVLPPEVHIPNLAGAYRGGVQTAADAWRNPPPLIRGVMVASVWGGLGFLMGLMAALVIPCISHPATAGVSGAILGASAGACLEWFT